MRIRDDLGYIDDTYTLLHDDGNYTMAFDGSPTGGGLVGEVVLQTAVVSWKAGHLLWTRTTGAQVKSSIFSCREGRRQEDERARKAGKVRLIMAVVSSLAEGPQCGCPESFLWDVQFQVVI